MRASRCVAALHARRWESSALASSGTIAELVADLGGAAGPRDCLLMVEADLPEGPVVTFGSAAVKDVAGLDLKRLVAGGRGAFGRVRRAVFKIGPTPPLQR